MKPTRLLSVHLPTLESHLSRFAHVSNLGSERSIGLSRTGKWKTQRLKEYPARLNQALAESIVDRSDLPQAMCDEMFRDLDGDTADFFD